MKFSIVLYIIFIISIQTLSQNYTVNMRVEDYRWRSSGNEWECDRYADVYADDVLVTDINNFKYSWYFKYQENDKYILSWFSYGNNYAYKDGNVGLSFITKVVVEGPNFTVEDTKIVGKPGVPYEFNIHGMREDGSDLVTTRTPFIYL